MGAALQDLGQLDDAVASYRRALEINPDYIYAHSNLGVALQNSDNLMMQNRVTRRALEIKPNSSSTLNNLAWLLNVQGKPIMALNTIKQSLQIKETGIAKSIFIACVKRLHFAHDDNEIRVALFRALTEPLGENKRTCTDWH
ncbi:MAG: tetratricopeptide repeat protein [Nitrosomonadales bacterium]